MNTSKTTRLGRPRDPRLDDSILAATVRLIGEHGYHGVSMEAIASEAGVTKPTVYRRWATKALLAADALGGHRPALIAPQDQGSLRGDLFAMILDDHRQMQAEGGVVLGVAFAARHDPELGTALGNRLDRESQARLDVILERAVARGELTSHPDAATFFHVIDALMLGTLLRRQVPPDVELLTRFLDALLLPALQASTPPDPAVAGSHHLDG